MTSLALILESVRVQGDLTYSNVQNVKTKVRFPLALENRGKWEFSESGKCQGILKIYRKVGESGVNQEKSGKII